MLRSLFRPRNVVILAGTATTGTASYYYIRNSNSAYSDHNAVEDTKRYHAPPAWTPPSRKETLAKLKLSAENKDEVFDLLVIGGGATGAGVALDAASRGLKVALVEKNDFSSGEWPVHGFPEMGMNCCYRNFVKIDKTRSWRC